MGLLLAPNGPLSDVELGLILEYPRTSSMASPSDNPLKRLIHEIHRRSLWQVLGIYLVASWAVLSVVDTLGGALRLPEWLEPMALVLLIIGLPIVLATAFVQEGKAMLAIEGESDLIRVLLSRPY